MGDHEDRQIQIVRQVADQLVEGGGADGIQPRRRLVQEDQLGVQRQGAGQADALAHPPRQFRRLQIERLGLQSDHGDLHLGQFADHIARQVGVFDQGRCDIVQHGQGRKQGPLLEQDAGPALDLRRLGLGHLIAFMAEQLHRPALGLLQADDGVEQHRLAGARTPDHAQDLAAPHVQIEVLMDHPVAELAQQAAHLDEVLALRLVLAGRHRFSSRKIMAKTASRKMMAKMACTTAAVTRRPRLSTSPATDMP
ncbi:hypothetical protein D3C80_944870 [compost metagenome]